jgi:hypothetical protein
VVTSRRDGVHRVKEKKGCARRDTLMESVKDRWNGAHDVVVRRLRDGFA